MDFSTTLKEIETWSVDDRLRLVQAILDTIVSEGTLPDLNDAQRKELARRLDDHRKHPEAVIPWEQVKAEALARARR